jgi:hypothetical protein
METLYGADATRQIQKRHLTSETDDYWRLRIAEMVEGPRCNIPLRNLDLYVYNTPLCGMKSWKEYHDFLQRMIMDYQ